MSISGEDKIEREYQKLLKQAISLGSGVKYAEKIGIFIFSSKDYKELQVPVEALVDIKIVTDTKVKTSTESVKDGRNGKIKYKKIENKTYVLGFILSVTDEKGLVITENVIVSAANSW